MFADHLSVQDQCFCVMSDLLNWFLLISNLSRRQIRRREMELILLAASEKQINIFKQRLYTTRERAARGEMTEFESIP